MHGKIRFTVYLPVSKDCLYHNTCVLFTALLTEINFPPPQNQLLIFGGRQGTVLCLLLNKEGDKEPSPVSSWQKEKPFATNLFSQLHCEGLFLHKGGV